MLFALLSLLLPSVPAQVPPLAAVTTPDVAATRWGTREAQFTIRDFRFRSGESLPALRIHYTTLGASHRDARGEIDDAVMILHGTGGAGRQFLVSSFADELYAPGQPLDLRRYRIILPDGIGHGGSSKPTDGLRMRFPAYGYDDMVDARYRLLQDGVGIRRVRLIMGTSMGCMHGFVWGEVHPDFVRALMPLACEPVEIAGLNRMWRQLVIDGIKADPAWMGGAYRTQPLMGLRTAASLLLVAGAAPLYHQAHHPARPAATAFVRQRLAASIAQIDANDLLYKVDASRTYDPWPCPEAITTPVMWINSADDFINPRGLDHPRRAVARMRKAQFRLIPESADPRGHGTHTAARFWKRDLVALLRRTR